MRHAVGFEAEGLSRWIHDTANGSTGQGSVPVTGEDLHQIAIANDHPEALGLGGFEPQPEDETSELNRQLDALGSLLPVLEFALGSGIFDQFAGDYLSVHASRSLPPQELDAGFAEYLDLTRPDRDLPMEEQETWPKFLVELAMFERFLRQLPERREVFEGPQTSGAILKGVPWARLGHCRVVLARGLALNRFCFPVHQYWRAVCADENPDYPDPRTVRLAIWRRRGALSFVELHQSAWQVLSRLAKGATLEEARREAGIGVASVRRMLMRWIERGLVAEVDASADGRVQRLGSR